MTEARRTKFPRRIAKLLVLAVAFGAVWLLVHHECASGGAMGGLYRTCSCRGVEKVDFDRTAADGPFRTVCVGWVESRTCYQSRGGPEIPCEQLVP